MPPQDHLGFELSQNSARLTIVTKHGPIVGGRASNGAGVFLELPYALPPRRFQDPVPLPPDYRYEPREYISESSHAAQPNNDGQAAGIPYEDKVGLGKPTENSLLLNVVCPPDFPTKSSFPVKVYIHGGFLQFGSPHSLSSQAQYVSASRSEVWVNIGYRLSTFGFLACDEPNIDGNFGFKDIWVALHWVKDHISEFGGNPEDIQLTGLSAGAHAVHQILHRVSHLPPGEKAPFHSALLQSNAIATNPKLASELRPQFSALSKALELDSDSSSVIEKLSDPTQIPPNVITNVVETDTLGVKYGTFRGRMGGNWLPLHPDLAAWQRSGAFAKGLKTSGVRSIVVGNLTEEWYLYSIAHEVTSYKDIAPNLERYYSDALVDDILGMYDTLPEDAPKEVVQKLFGDILSDGQVHLPIRLLTRDLVKAGFPVLRYNIAWTPEQSRLQGYVTHGTDRILWAYRLPNLKPDDAKIAKEWISRIDEERRKLENGESQRPPQHMLTLNKRQKIEWTEDQEWDHIMRLTKILPGES